MNKPKKITEKQCTGCHACYSVCPKKAIEMKPDKKGFLQPEINYELCVGCLLCQKTCPLNATELKGNGTPIAYAAYSLNEDNHRNSSSGGIFSLLASEVLKEGGSVYGAVFAKDFSVVHERVTENIRPLQTSKYVQSRIGEAFRLVEQDIRQGIKVLFSGTPCQVGGLYSYLAQQKVDTKNLMTVDFICHGVPSPLLWKKHLDQISNGKKPVRVNFRDKKLSWGGSCLTCCLDDGSEYSVEAGKDSYMKGFFSNMILRESCYSCQFKTKSRISDITLADYWGVEKNNPEMVERYGTSAVVIQSPKGKMLFDSIQELIKSEEVPLASILEGNYTMIQSVRPHLRKDQFWNQIIQQKYNCFEALIEDLLVPTPKEKLNMWIVKLKRKGKKLLKN